MLPTDDQFHAADFVIFVGMLLGSVGIGVFFAYRDRGKQSAENYYFGDGKISSVPVAISLAVSFVSAITVIGYPVEVYLYGTVFSWIVVAQFIAVAISSAYFIPLIRRLQLRSIYEYLELRYHRILRLVMCVIGVIQLVLYMGIAVYLPSLALSAVTPLSITASIALTSVVCTIYTTLGGMKAVIWTDVLQSSVMVIGMVAIFARTLYVIGGMEELAAATERGLRNNFLTFDTDPRIRSTAWSIGIGFAFNECCVRSCHQVCAQRYLACRSTKDARKALFLSLIPTSLLSLLAVGCGLVIYAYYEGCDPLLAGQVEKHDQMLPRLAVEVFRSAPGMAGVFVSAAYCGTLSTISSGINALAALCLMDFITPIIPLSGSGRSDKLLNYVLSIIFGGLVMLVAYALSFSSQNIIQTSFAVFGSISGPILGLYTMGVFMPWVNYKGAMAGVFSAWVLTAWMGVAASNIQTYIGTREKLPLVTTSCNFTASLPLSYNSTATGSWFETTTAVGTSSDRPLIYDTFYSLSPFFYAAFGFTTCWVIGNLVSCVTGLNDPKNADPKLFVPLISNKRWPKSLLSFFRFGVPEEYSIKTEDGAGLELVQGLKADAIVT